MSVMMGGTNGHLLSSFPNILVSQIYGGLFLKIVIFQSISGYSHTIIKQCSAVCWFLSANVTLWTESCGHCSLCSLESGEWLSSGVTNFQSVSADTHLVSVNTDNAPSINVLFPWYHRRRVCRLCPRPGYKGFWLNHSRSGCVTLDQSEAWCWASDQWEALYHHSGISLV